MSLESMKKRLLADSETAAIYDDLKTEFDEAVKQITFQRFKNAVMAVFEDWPLRFKDESTSDTVFYTFETLGPGYSGQYINGEWSVVSKLNGNRCQSLESELEEN